MSRAPLVLSAAAILCASSFLALADARSAISSAAARSEPLRCRSPLLKSRNMNTGLSPSRLRRDAVGDDRFVPTSLTSFRLPARLDSALPVDRSGLHRRGRGRAIDVCDAASHANGLI